jgi:serine/threonine protein kinase
VIPTLGADLSGFSPHLVLPYLEGISVRRLLGARRKRAACLDPTAFVLSIARQLAAALAALHAAGWLHAQVRPEHALVSPQGHVTLIDLSQTRRLATVECSSGLVSPSAPAYAAPEAFSSREMLTPASDVYGLGILLFELLAGQLPFVATGPRQWAACHCRQAPPDLRDLQLSVSHDIALLVRRMLAKEPLRRPAAAELVDRLAGLEIDELL